MNTTLSALAAAVGLLGGSLPRRDEQPALRTLPKPGQQEAAIEINPVTAKHCSPQNVRIAVGHID